MINGRKSSQILKRLLRSVGIGLVAIIGLFTIWMFAWNDDTQVVQDGQLMTGVQLNLQTAVTSRGLVEYDLYGTEGPVVLSIHGGFGGADQGRLFASWLQDDGFRILSPSRPGYLDTPLESGKTYQEQADLLAALLDHLNIDQVGLMSYSAGSPVAYTFAERYPDRVWGLVSVDGVSQSETEDASVSPMQAAFMNSAGSKLVSLFAELDPGTFLLGTLDETSTFSDEQKEERTEYVMETPDKREFFDALLKTTFPYARRTAGNENDIEQALTLRTLALEKVKAPALIVHGTQDADVPFSHGVYAYEHIPGARYYWMEQEDHLGFWLGPNADKAQRIVLEFLLDQAPVTQNDPSLSTPSKPSLGGFQSSVSFVHWNQHRVRPCIETSQNKSWRSMPLLLVQGSKRPINGH